MRTILNLIRLPNLLIIAFTFLLLRYLVFLPVYKAFSVVPLMQDMPFFLMVTSTILIAAAGYVSNDYFDVAADRVNKPNKQYIGKQISPGSALATSILLSIIAVVLAIWLTINLKIWLSGTLLVVALFVTWWYAIRLKRSLVWGNLAVAFMSAGTIAMAWLIEREITKIPEVPHEIITVIVAAISIFAFLISFLREIVKDLEDISGDILLNCRSLPIVKGEGFTKKMLQVLTAVTFVLLVLTQLYLIQFSKHVAVVWLFLFVEAPLLYFSYSLNKASTRHDYHKLSTLQKIIMLGGISSIVAGQF